MAHPVLVEQFKKGLHDVPDQAVLEQYQNAVEQILALPGVEVQVPGGQINELKGSVEADLEFLNVEENPNFEKRAPIIPMEALALARGMRKAAIESPQRIFSCSIGPLSLALSLDQVGETSPPSYAMHLSVRNMIAGDFPTDLQLMFALYLFLAMEELNRIYGTPPQFIKGVIHCYVPWFTEKQLQ
ncbi:MAG: hypothetical protein HYY46_00330 [Deltaproteobacteria bacterium]|nr:hypothetical protein [Deltaproteobacteria bacterium]